MRDLIFQLSIGILSHSEFKKGTTRLVHVGEQNDGALPLKRSLSAVRNFSVHTDNLVILQALHIFIIYLI